MRIEFFNELNQDIRFIREKVFMEEQGFNDEFDDIDPIAWHVVIYMEDQPVATGRTFIKDNVYVLGRIAVLKEFRKYHLGSTVMQSLEGKIRQLGGSTMTLSAQVQASGFYQKLGYQKQGEEYMDEHCPHIQMNKSIQPIQYSDDKEKATSQVVHLFETVGWQSAKYPEMLMKGIIGYNSVFTAWDGNQMVGIAATMCDGCMTAYVHYAAIHPAYQGQGIGKVLLEKVKQQYAEYQKIVLIAAEGKSGFYENSGYVSDSECTAMHLQLK